MGTGSTSPHESNCGSWSLSGSTGIALATIFRFCGLVKLSFKHVDLELAHLWTIARAGGTKVAKVVVVEVTGADGTIGLGEAAPTTRYKESAKTVEAFL